MAPLGVLRIRAVRPAGQYNTRKRLPADPLQRRVVRKQFGKHPCLAHAAGDELVVLRAKIEYDYAFRHVPPPGIQYRFHPQIQ